MLAQQQRAVQADRQAIIDLAATLPPDERRAVQRLLDDQRFLDVAP